jgi:hypothetical protein
VMVRSRHANLSAGAIHCLLLHQPAPNSHSGSAPDVSIKDEFVRRLTIARSRNVLRDVDDATCLPYRYRRLTHHQASNFFGRRLQQILLRVLVAPIVRKIISFLSCKTLLCFPTSDVPQNGSGIAGKRPWWADGLVARMTFETGRYPRGVGPSLNTDIRMKFLP